MGISNKPESYELIRTYRLPPLIDHLIKCGHVWCHPYNCPDNPSSPTSRAERGRIAVSLDETEVLTPIAAGGCK